MSDAEEIDPMFDLTDVVGKRAQENRTTMIGRFEVNARFLLIALLCMIPSILLGLIAFAIVGQLGVIVIFLVEIVSVFLLTFQRNRRLGDNRTLINEFMQKQRSDSGQFLMGIHVIADPDDQPWLVLDSMTMPGPASQLTPQQIRQQQVAANSIDISFDAAIAPATKPSKKKERLAAR